MSSGDLNIHSPEDNAITVDLNLLSNDDFSFDELIKYFGDYLLSFAKLKYSRIPNTNPLESPSGESTLQWF